MDGLFMWVCSVAEVSRHHVTYPCFPSWEFITTLDYEWSVIRGHRPYQWTIWVRIFFFGLTKPTAEPPSDIFIGSLPDTRGRTFGSDREHDRL